MSTTFVAGVNLPTLAGAYDHDLAPNERHLDWGCDFTPMLAFRYLAACRELGMGAVRIWLCENREGIVTEGGRIVGVRPELLQAISVIQDGARAAELRVYWSLLDANAWQRNDDTLTAQIVADPAVTADFVQHVALPIARALDPDVCFALEVVNEPESLTDEVHPGVGLPWATVVRFVSTVREALNQALPGVPITAGTQAIFLPGLLAELVRGGPAPVDAIDLHAYHPSGGLPSRADLPVDIGDLPLWAGEAGPSHEGVGSDYLLNYLYNGPKLGYRAVFLWKLEGEQGLLTGAPDRGDGWDGFSETALGIDIKRLLWSRRRESI